MSARMTDDLAAICTATIGRFDAERTRWRVLVQAWPDEHIRALLHSLT